MGTQFDQKKMIARALCGGNSGAITPTQRTCEGFFWSNPPGEECRAVSYVTNRGRYPDIYPDLRLADDPGILRCVPILNPGSLLGPVSTK